MTRDQVGGIFHLSPSRAKLFLCLSAAAILAVDLSLPSDVDIATFYFVPLVLAGWTRSAVWLWGSTGVFAFLSFAELILAVTSHLDPVTGVDWFNRGMTALALGVAAIPMHLRVRNLLALERRTEALSQANEELEREMAARAGAEQNLRVSEASLRDLSVELLHAQDEERRNIARELHDGLGQSLAGLKLSLHLMGRELPADNEPVRKWFAECNQLTDDSVSQVRTLSHLMFPPALEQLGLQSAIPQYVRGFEERSGIRTRLEIPGQLERLPGELELTIFRILQESLTNIHRHSGSRTAAVTLEMAPQAVILQVEDSGKGIQKPTKGVGLRSMEQRARQVQGRLEVSSGSGGTTIRATLPYHKAAAAAASGPGQD